MLSRTVFGSGSTMSEGKSTSTKVLGNIPALPPEIWLLICPHLKTTELQSISLTCSTFRYMAQPLLFSTLDVSPFLLSYNAELPILRPRSYFTRFIERLAYYTLPHIVHGVHHCWISPYTRRGFPMRNQQDDLDPNLVIDAVVAALPHFPNLSALSWHCTDITPKWWNTIQSLRITDLWLNSATIPLTVSSLLPCVVKLDLDQWPWEGHVANLVSIHEERLNGVGSLTMQHAIRPGVIQSISVPRKDTARHLFFVLCQVTYDLRSLKIPFSALLDPNFIPALEHCPSLTSLCIFPPSSDERSRDVKIDSLSPSTLPSLIAYDGPYTHLLQFGHHRALEQISLWGFDGRPPVCDSEALVDTLTELAGTNAANSLKYINSVVDAITLDLLEVLASFPPLERLVIQSQDRFPQDIPFDHTFKTGALVTSLYAMMDKLSLPPNIKHIKLSTRLSNSPKLDLYQQEREVANLMESFGRHHPSLQRIEIGYGIYWTGMYSAVWGRIRENTEAVNSSESRDAGPTPRVNSEGGYSSKSSSKDYLLSTVVSTVHPLPLGKLTFTEHRRTILFTHDSTLMNKIDQEFADLSQWRIWNILWTRLKRWWSTAMPW